VTDAAKPSADSVQAPFRLDSLEDVPPPSGCEGTWYRYVIKQGDNVIVGLREGAHSEVSATVAAYIERLNLRFAKQQSKAR
jgi:hypothetical protein